ncbi:DNA repair protein RecO [Candidatus Sumerlaeota bacterium]|nr:DNA repair protein RecO [Candidatus Sumerlaeota bacterium]
MPIVKTEAIILNSSDYRESTLLLTLLTPEHGRVRLIARGAKRATSRNRGRVEPLSRVEAQYSIRKPDELGTLRESRVLDSADCVRGDLLKYAAAQLAAEFADRAVHGGEECRGVYQALASFLSALKDAADPAARLVQGLAELLAELGFEPVVEHCVRCGEARPAESFSVALGGVVCRECSVGAPGRRPFNPGLQRILSLMLRRDPALARVKMSSAQTRQLLLTLLDLAQHHLDLQLRSRDFLWSMLNAGYGASERI